jgi:3-deoxy-manno-octulosonate cytidylyltransferase (CMP-KDO synthetase)
MRTIVIIPARYNSSRFPGKPLIDILGETMIYRVYDNVKNVTDEVVVATDDQRIYDEVERFGGRVVMTSAHHRSGTERCLEAAEILGARADDVIINVQGDEPFVNPKQVESLIELFQKPVVNLGTLIKRIENADALDNPNSPKVVIDVNGRALYFSRSRIPYLRSGEKEPQKQHVYYKHIGMYGYRFSTLKELCLLPVSALEEAESLEQLRWLENGYAIHTAETLYDTIAIDTPEDLQRALSFYK